MAKKPYKFCMKPVGEVTAYPTNPRIHSDEQVKQIADSIREFGFTNPCLIDSGGQLIAGHGRLEAAKLLGLKTVPCIQVTGLNDEQKKALVIADNQLALNAGWDLDVLKDEIKTLVDADFCTDLLGFEEGFIDGLLAAPVDGLTDEDEVPDVGEPVSVKGDVWQLGNHRLMCGDSTSIDAVEKLMDGNKADMVFTDPPYGINEKCDRIKTKRGRLSKAGQFKQIINDDTTDTAVAALNVTKAFNIPIQIWWGANYYAHHLPESGNWIVWDKKVEEKEHDFNSDAELAYVQSNTNSIRIFRHKWKGLIKDSERGEKRIHPTQKPIALCEWAIERHNNITTIIDLFGGSGSTLIACEKTNRQCFMMELDPQYIDVIITRWQNFTGKQATHAETGKPFNEMSEAA